MTFVMTLTLAIILIPNLVKLLSVSAKLISFMPMYLQAVTRDPMILENEETRSRLDNAFTEIFFSILTHALNVVVCTMLGWSLWHGKMPNLSPLLKGIVFGVALGAGISNFIITRYLIQEFLHVRGSSRAIAQLLSTLGKDEPTLAFSMADAVQVWAWIGMYVVSAFACAGLAYLVQS